MGMGMIIRSPEKSLTVHYSLDVYDALARYGDITERMGGVPDGKDPYTVRIDKAKALAALDGLKREVAGAAADFVYEIAAFPNNPDEEGQSFPPCFSTGGRSGLLLNNEYYSIDAGFNLCVMCCMGPVGLTPYEVERKMKATERDIRGEEEVVFEKYTVRIRKKKATRKITRWLDNFMKKINEMGDHFILTVI